MAEYKIPTVTFYAFNMLTRRDESDTVQYCIAHRPRDNNNKLNKLLFKTLWCLPQALTPVSRSTVSLRA